MVVILFIFEGANILRDLRGNVKLADFGASKRLQVKWAVLYLCYFWRVTQSTKLETQVKTEFLLCEQRGLQSTLTETDTLGTSSMCPS